MPDLISQATIRAASAVGRRGKNPLLKIPSKLCNRLAILVSLLAASAPVSAEAAATAPIKPLISISVQSQAPPGAVMELAQPAIAQEGFTAMLSANAQGSGPLRFQWFLNGDAIDGATNAIHVLQTLERADEGSYTVLATNAAGQAGSDPTRLLVSNVKPLSYMSLLVNAPTGGVSQIQYADSLGSNALWRPLTGVTSSAAPLVIVDPSATHASQRFYKTPAAQGLKGCLLPGWLYPAPTGSVHTIEFIEPQAGSTNWQTLQTITLATSPYLFVDATATNGVPRRYRTTLRASPASRRAGRVVFTVKWILPPDVYTNLVSTNQAALAALGMTLNDQDHALESPINPLPGYWIVVGDQRVMTDTNGGFQVDVPYGTSQGFVVPHSGDRTTPADAIFDVNGLVLPGQTPAPIVVRFERDGSMSMDAAGQSAAAASKAARVPAGAPICGNPCAAMGNRAACCLDYNGIVSDGCRYPDDFGSFGDKLIRYLGSTCHRLVEAGLCVREWNALRFESVAYPPFVVPTAPLNGP